MGLSGFSRSGIGAERLADLFGAENVIAEEAPRTGESRFFHANANGRRCVGATQRVERVANRRGVG
jgi:hypothetical protein